MHCISVYLINKKELRGDKIDTLLDGKQNSIKFTELGADILATTRIPNIKEFGKDKTIARIETDYFGGAGHQSAKLFIDGKKVYDKSDEQDWSSTPINDVLKKLGIKADKNHGDEFDTIGLGKYRTNEDFK
jgi:hypothetical protein